MERGLLEWSSARRPPTGERAKRGDERDLMARKITVETAVGNVEVNDSRASKRYNMTEPLPGQLAGSEVEVLNVGMGGFGIATTSHLRVGSNSSLIVDNREFDEKLRFRCEVVWCRTTGEKGEDGGLLYRAGLKFTQPVEEIAGALGRLIRFCGKEDTESFEKKIEAAAKRHLARAMADVTMPATVTTDQVLQVERALMAIAKGKADVDTLVDKARAEMDRKNITAAESRDVLAIWAYLDFSVQLKAITAIRAGLESIR